MSESKQTGKQTFLHRLPWEKITIWGLFILVMYTLRDFFFIIFMTFIVAYSMRALVMKIVKVVSPNTERNWLQRLLAIVCFIALLAGCYGAGQFFIPQLIEQGRELVSKVGNVQQSPEKAINESLRDTMGRWLFYEKYGGPSDDRYVEEFTKYQEQGLQFEDFEAFRKQIDVLESDFESDLPNKLIAETVDDRGAKESERLLRQWIIENEAPAVYAANPQQHIDGWRKKYEKDQDIFGLKPLKELEKEPDFEKKRDDQVVRHIAAVLMNDSARCGELEEKWKKALGKMAVAELKKTQREEYDRLFQKFYDQRRQVDEEELPHNFATFVKLRDAHEQGLEEFSKTLTEVRGNGSEEVDEGNEREGFESWARQELVAEWKEQDFVKGLSAKVEEWALTGLATFGKHLGAIVGKLFVLPVQLALSLMLAFFITFDVPNLKKGLRRLSKSRVQHFYEEIAPSLMSFGRLIGRAFIAQGLIAVCNTVLTFIAMNLLGIQNEFFLSAIVFVCSFIPVLGVVLSSVPIAVTALLQDDGGIMMAAMAVLAVLVIHFLEASIFNPKILGDIMHLHPVLVLAILAIGEHFFGVWGLLLGVPVTVYIIRFVILDEGIPGIIEPIRKPVEVEADSDSEESQEKDAPVDDASAEEFVAHG